MHPLRGAFLISAILLLSLPASAQEPLKTVIRTPSADAGWPVTTFCSDVLGLLSAKARVAINLEMPNPPVDITVPVDGATVEEILNRIAAADGRLEWRLSQGMVVIRSRNAWTDPASVLNQQIRSFSVTDLPVLEAMWKAFELLRKPRTPALLAGYDGERIHRDPPEKVTVSLSEGTVLDALNAIATAAGKTSWRLVQYSGNPRPSICACHFDAYYR